MSIDPHDSETPQTPPEVEAMCFPSLEELAHLLPQYEMHEIIGIGGMGAVYKGRQMALDRWVAIKVLPVAASQNAEDTQRFITEARAMAKLVHPHIVAVFDFGQTFQRHLFLVMEYVEGMDLHQRTRAGEITPQRAREVIAQLCDALQFAHDRGVAHRDIKPANILITNDWKVKVADFGLARDLTTQPNADEPEYGTPDYTAPERLVIGAVVDHRADIYSLGVVIHEMLTGKTPTAAGPDTGKGLPEGFAGVITKCLMSEPEQRYEKASDVKIALLTATSEKAIQTETLRSQASVQSDTKPTAFSSYQPPRFGGLKRGLASVGWGLACVILVGVFAWFALKDKVSLKTETPEVAIAISPPVIMPPAPTLAAPPPQAIEKVATPAAAVPTPAMTRPKVTQEMEDPTLMPKDMPKAAPYSVPDGPFGEVARLHGHKSAVYDLELLQDEHRVVSVGMDGTLRVWDLHTQKEILQVDADMDQLPRLQVDADDSRALIVSYKTDQLAMVDLTTGQLTHQVQFPDDTLSNAILMPQAKAVLVAGSHKEGTNNLYLWQPEKREGLKAVEGYLGRPYGMALHPDGKSVIINASRVLDPEKNTFQAVNEVYSAETGQFTTLNVKNLGYVTRFYEVRGATTLLARGTTTVVTSLPDLSVSLSLPAFKTNEPVILTGQVVAGGRLLLTSWTDSTLRVHEVSGGEEIWRQTTPEPVTDISLSQDQRWGVFSARYKEAQNQTKGDFDLLVWRMPNWPDLQSTSSIESTITEQMTDLAKHDPELASMRDNLRASFPPPKEAEFRAEKQKLDALYVGALRRQIPGLAPTEQNAMKQEIEVIASGTPLPDKSNDSYLPQAVQKLRGIYRNQLQTLADKKAQSLSKGAQTVTAYLNPLKQKREAAKDHLGVGRIVEVLKEWTLTNPSQTDSETLPTGAAVSPATRTPTQRPDRPGSVIAIQRVAQNTSPMMPTPEVGRVPRDLGPVVAIAGGADHVIALLPDGRLRAWGSWEGQAAATPSEAADMVEIDSTDLTALALRKDGQVWCWSASTATTPTKWEAPQGKTPLHVHAGLTQTGYVLCTDGSLEPIGSIDPAAPTTLGLVAKLQYIPTTGGWCALLSKGSEPVYWGTMQSPITPLPAEMRDLISVGLSPSYGVALQRDGTLTGWGQLAQDQRFRTRKFTGGIDICHDYSGRVFPVHRSDHSWELAPNPSVPEYVAEDRSSVLEGRLRSCIDAVFTKEFVIGLKP